MNLFKINIFSFYLLLMLISCAPATNHVMASFNQAITPDPLAYPSDTISITAVGDIMIGSAYPAKNTLPKHDGIKSFKNIDTFLKGDIIFGNLDGCFLDCGKSTKCKDTTGNSFFEF